MLYSKARRKALFSRAYSRKSLLLVLIFSVLAAANVQAMWVKQENLPVSSLNTLVVDPVDNNKMFVGTGSIQGNETAGLYKSAGALVQKTWSTSLTGYIRSIAIAPDNTFNNQKMFASVVSEGIRKSLDGGLNWVSADINYPPNQVDQADLKNNVAQIVISKKIGNIQKVYALVDVADSAFPDSAGIYVSENDGASWAKLFGITDIIKIAVVPDQPNTIYASTYSGELKKSTDGGINFLPVGSGLPQPDTGSSIVDFAIDPVNPNNVYVSVFKPEPGVSGVYYSPDAGQSWTLKSSDVFYHLTVALNSTSSEKLYGILNENASNTTGQPFFNVYKSSDHGLTWVKLDQQNGDLSGANMNAIVVQNNVAYVAAADGLYTHNHDVLVTTNPVAINYSLSVPLGNTSATGVLQGVKISPTDSLKFALVSNGSKGNMVIAEDGSFTYTPFPNQSGTDLVTFKVTDQLGRQSLANNQNGQINITFQSTASASPVPLNSTVSMIAGSTSINGILNAQKVTSTDTLTYSVVTQPTRGTFRFTNTTTGSFTYTAPANQTGTDTVIFSVKDQLNRISSNNGVLTINLPGGTGGSTTAIDLSIIASTTATSIQPGSNVSYNLDIRNSSTSSNSSEVNITSTPLPAGTTLVKPGSFDNCILRPNLIVSCTISTLRSEATQSIPVVLNMPATLTDASLNVTFSVSTPAEVNLLNNASSVSTPVSLNGNGTLTAPVPQFGSISVLPGGTQSGSFTVTPVNQTDELKYLYVSNDMTKGSFSFTSTTGALNESTHPTFTYTASTNAVPNTSDQIQFKAIDQLNRESTIGIFTVNFLSPNNAPGGSVITGGGGGGSSSGAFNPLFLATGLLPLILRRRKQ